MSIQSDGVVTGDFSQILTDFGRTVSYSVVTKTTNAMNGQETSTFATAANLTVVFFYEQNKYLWDPEGLIQVGDAYIIAPVSAGIARYDQFTVDGKTFYIENVTRRTVLQTAMCDYATCFMVSG